MVRRGQRRRGSRLGRRTADRRPDHQLRQLAGVVPAAGGRRPLDRAARPADRRPAAAPASDRRSTSSGAVLSAAGLFFVVFGILQTNTYGWGLSRVWLYVALGVLILVGLLRARPGPRTRRQDAARLAQPLPQPDVEPRPDHPDRPVARPAGRLLRDLGLPAAGARLLGDPDRSHARPGHRRNPAVLRDGPADGQPAPPAAARSAPASPSPSSASPCCCCSPARTRRTGRSGPACSSWGSVSGRC